MTANSGCPGAGHIAGIERAVGHHPVDRAANLRIADLRLRRLQVAARRFHLRLRGLDLLLRCLPIAARADAPARLERRFAPAHTAPAPRPPAGGRARPAGTDSRGSRAASAPRRPAAARTPHRSAPSPPPPGSWRRWWCAGWLPPGRAAPLLSAALARQVAILQHGQQLARLHVVAAIHQELLHRRADLRHHARLVVRAEHAVAASTMRRMVSCVTGGDLHGRGRLGLLLFSSCEQAGEAAERGNETSQSEFLSWAKRPP